MEDISLVSLAGRTDNTQTMLSSTLMSLQSGVVCPSLSQGHISSHIKIVATSLSSDKFITVLLMVSMG